MSVATMIELSAQSSQGFEQALKEGIAEARKSIDHIQNVWVKDQEVVLKDGQNELYRVHLKVTFQVDGNRKAS